MHNKTDDELYDIRHNGTEEEKAQAQTILEERKALSEKPNEELYRLLREGTPEEAGNATAVLKMKDANHRKNAMLGATLAIINRNMSHGAGEYACKCLNKKGIKDNANLVPDHSCLGEGAECKCGDNCRCKEGKK